MRHSKEYEQTKQMLETLRKTQVTEVARNNSKYLFRLNEEEEKRDAIAITDDPRFGNNVLTNQMDNFRQSVNGGAKFAKQNTEEPENNPLIYYPKTGNLVFSGSIPQLSNLKFQFSLNDITGSPYIFVDGLSLTDETITTLNKLRGFYLNWRDEFLAAGEMLERLK